MLFLLLISLAFFAHLGAGAPEPKLTITPLLPPTPTGPLAPLISRECMPFTYLVLHVPETD